MFLTYLWQARNLSELDAREAFSMLLERERKLYAETWGRTPEVSQWSEGTLFLGQLRYHLGVRGFAPWVDHGDRGLVWGGVCESHLGRDFDREGVARLLEMLSHRPQELAEWDGRFSVLVWDRKETKIILCTGATQSPTLWWTEGPKGWALGTRAAPILDLVERPRAPNMAEVGLFLAYGYLIGPGCLFEGVDRVPSRSRVVFDGRHAPSISSYMRMLDVVESDRDGLSKREAIEVCRDRLIHRVEVQHRFTESPTILLTGGRDSRSIAAAASRTGYSGLVLSGGAPESSTVRVADTVADALGLKRHPAWADGSLTAGTEPAYSLENLKLWTRASEGIESIRHALTWRDFFARSLPFPLQRGVAFHGLAGAVGKGNGYGGLPVRSLRKTGANRIARDRIRSKARAGWVRKDLDVSERLSDVFERFEAALGDAVTVSQWLELFYWQHRALHWGEDLAQVNSPIWWLWTPLQDRELFRVFLSRPPEEKYGVRFFEEMTVAIAPELREVPYDRRVDGRPGARTAVRDARKWAGRVKRRLTRTGREGRKEGRRSRHVVQEVWSSVFGSGGESFWGEVVDEASLRELIRTDPDSNDLWNLATVEIFMQTYF